jgi:hypothetical protein
MIATNCTKNGSAATTRARRRAAWARIDQAGRNVRKVSTCTSRLLTRKNRSSRHSLRKRRCSALREAPLHGNEESP